MRQLPQPHQPFPKKAEWLTAFEALVNLEYPVEVGKTSDQCKGDCKGHPYNCCNHPRQCGCTASVEPVAALKFCPECGTITQQHFKHCTQASD